MCCFSEYQLSNFRLSFPALSIAKVLQMFFKTIKLNDIKRFSPEDKYSVKMAIKPQPAWPIIIMIFMSML